MVQRLILRGDAGPEHVIEVRQDYIDISTMAGVESDPDWTFTDAAGHVHKRVGHGVPTLRRVQLTDPYWCYDCRDEHEGESHLECVDCEEVIEPGVRPVPAQLRRKAGMREILIDGEPATEEEAKALIARYP